MSKWELMRSLFDGRPVRIVSPQWPDRVRQATVTRIEREDGSGKCWNVTVRCFGRPEPETVFVRTED